MRQLHVIPYYDPFADYDGVRTVCHRLVEDMVRRGHQVTVLTTDVGQRQARLKLLRQQLGGAEIVRVRNLSQRLVGANLYTPFGFAHRLGKLLPAHDLVHVHDVFNWLTVQTARALARHATPSVLSSDGLFSFDPNRGRARTRELVYRAVGHGVLERFDLIHAVRPEEFDPGSLGMAKSRIRYIANGSPFPPLNGDAARFRQRFGLGERRVVLFVGQLMAVQGLDLLLQLAGERRGDRDLCFVLVGERPGAPVEPGTWTASNVLYTGFLQGEALADAWAAASIFSLPSYWDVMPTTALEALAHGVPVLLTRQCLLPEVAESGAGVLVEPSLESLRAGLDELLAQRSGWGAMGEAGRRLIAERFALPRIHDAYEAMYRELIVRSQTSNRRSNQG
jgi:glycosyltransferase involved in cell wall biosynthesis